MSRSVELMTTKTSTELFPGLPDSARLWVFGVGRPLSRDEESRLLESVNAFLEGWKAHGHPLAAAREWLSGRFLLVAVDERITPPSGCSIDALVRSLRSLESELETQIVGGAPIWFRDATASDEVRRIARADFKRLAEEGSVSGDTIVFDLSITRVGELRDGKWERPAREGWHRRYFSGASTAP